MRAIYPWFACLSLLACQAPSSDSASKGQAVSTPAPSAESSEAPKSPRTKPAPQGALPKTERGPLTPQPSPPPPGSINPKGSSRKTLPASPDSQGAAAAPSGAPKGEEPALHEGQEAQAAPTGSEPPKQDAAGRPTDPAEAKPKPKVPTPGLLASPVLSDYRVVSPARDAGAVEGTVSWGGSLPSARSVALPNGPAECGSQLQIPRVSVDGNQRVTGVLVRLLDMKEGRVQPKSERHPRLSISGCMTTSTTLIVPLGGRLEIENQDGVSHPIRAQFGEKPLFETTVAAHGKRVSPPFKEAGFVTLRGGEGRSWIEAYVFVSPNPYVAVTDRDGPFRISGIAPNKTYSVEAWHPPMEPGAPAIVRRSTVEVPYWDTARVHFDLDKP